jgi:iron complex outermembrane receptor protein
MDNLQGRAHVGSVIVNEGNGRHFEPGTGRSLQLGLRWRWQGGD